MAVGKVRVTGLKELRRELAAMDDEGTWRTELKAAGRTAAEVVAGEARVRARRGFVTKKGNFATMGSRAIASIRTGAGVRGATVSGGRASTPYFGGANFGGGARQFGQRKEPDYALYAALEDKRPQVIEVYTKEIDALTARRFK